AHIFVTDNRIGRRWAGCTCHDPITFTFSQRKFGSRTCINGFPDAKFTDTHLPIRYSNRYSVHRRTVKRRVVPVCKNGISQDAIDCRSERNSFYREWFRKATDLCYRFNIHQHINVLLLPSFFAHETKLAKQLPGIPSPRWCCPAG